VGNSNVSLEDYNGDCNLLADPFAVWKKGRPDAAHFRFENAPGLIVIDPPDRIDFGRVNRLMTDHEQGDDDQDRA
jgi:hypothetical protein